MSILFLLDTEIINNDQLIFAFLTRNLEFNSINVDYPNIQELTYTKCPKYIYAINYISDENKIIEYKDRNNNIIQKNQNLIKSLQENNKIKSVTFTKSQNINTKCVKNYKIT